MTSDTRSTSKSRIGKTIDLRNTLRGYKADDRDDGIKRILNIALIAVGFLLAILTMGYCETLTESAIAHLWLSAGILAMSVSAYLWSRKLRKSSR
jgi:hypothetical protein